MVSLKTVERIGTHACPNCNAEAKVVAERRKPKTPLWEIYVDCGMCKGKFPIGLLHDSQKRRVDRRRELMKLYDNAKSPGERGRIFAEIQRMEKEEKTWNASL